MYYVKVQSDITGKIVNCIEHKTKSQAEHTKRKIETEYNQAEFTVYVSDQP